MSEVEVSYRSYVKELPLLEALWWFIENGSDDLPERSEIFFSLRGRMRASATPVGKLPESTLSVSFEAEWDDGVIVSSAKVDLATGKLFDIKRAEEGNDYGKLLEESLVVNGKTVPIVRTDDGSYQVSSEELARLKRPENASELRKEALARLKEAAAIDGLQPYVIAHEHRFLQHRPGMVQAATVRSRSGRRARFRVRAGS
jgi:hypothetical protein